MNGFLAYLTLFTATCWGVAGNTQQAAYALGLAVFFMLASIRDVLKERKQ